MSAISERLAAALADRYRVERELGAGGMATVYLAQDLKHDRKVAIKVLKPELAAVLGAERFVVEIKTTAALQHPHILPLFDSGTADGFLFYVMPFVEGETLRDKLNRETQFGVDEAVRIASQVADALDYAHRHGVIHRDIKPENILLHDGRPMVADFGIALAVSAAAGGRMTETGLSLGTPHYMSPEQATAEKEITGRSDVYSLASVLYEMLTGNPPHTGATAQQIIMKIITEQAAAVTQFRKSVPPNVAAAVAHALEKLPADRFESAAAFAHALGDATYRGAAEETGALAVGARAGSRRTLTALGAIALLSTSVAAWSLLKPGPDAPVSRLAVILPSDRVLAFGGTAEPPRLALTPNGRELVYVVDTFVGVGTRRALAIRSLDQFETRLLPGTEDAGGPSVSWDGSQVAYAVASNRLSIQVVSLRGGPALTLADSGVSSPPTWGPEGFVYFIGSGGIIRRVSGGGGPIEDVLTLPDAGSGREYHWLRVLPGGRGALVTAFGESGDLSATTIRAVELRTGRIGAELQGVGGEYVADAEALVYVTEDGTVMAVSFDVGRLATRGRPQALFGRAEIRNQQTELTVGGGTLAYAFEGTNANEQAIWVSRDGGAQTLVDPNWSDPELESYSLSPDGGRVAITIINASRGDVWIKQLDRGPVNRLTFGGTRNEAPSWSDDGRWVSYVSTRDGRRSLWRRRADGVGAEERIADGGRGFTEARWSRDGRWLVASVEGPPSRDILAMRVGTDSVPGPLLAESWGEWSPALSPDGKWIAYVSNESGQPQVFVRPFPAVQDGRWQVSTESAVNPVWSADGRELFYRTEAGQAINAADMSRGPASLTRRVLVRSPPEGRFETNPIDQMFEPSRDGRRFLMVRQGAGDTSGDLVIVQNFTTELRAALKAGARQ